METVSFLHQKGGTGKSTLAVSLALALAGRGERLLLLDADPQGTASEWANRHGHLHQIETEARVRPDLPEQLPRIARSADWLIIDGPPSLSPMTESILRASTRVVIPVRPALPDLWALTWLAAIIRKMQKEGAPLAARVTFNLHRGEPLEPLAAEIAKLGLPVHGEPIPAHPGFHQIFEGKELPAELGRAVLSLLD